jgi:hypothetical protein
VEFAAGIAPVRASIAPLLLPLTGLIAVSAHALLSWRYFAVSRSEHDLELIQLVPFLVCALPLGDGEQRLQARPR